LELLQRVTNKRKIEGALLLGINPYSRKFTSISRELRELGLKLGKHCQKS